MDQLIDQVAQKAGITPEQARAAVQAVLGFLKERLPASLSGQLDSIVGGQAGGQNPLGGLFGR